MAKVTNISGCDRTWCGIEFPADKPVAVDDPGLVARLRQLPKAFSIDESAPAPKKRGRPRKKKVAAKAADTPEATDSDAK